MITNFGKGLLLLIVMFALLSCATYKTNYRYGTDTYDEPEQALAAQKTAIDGLTSQIPKTDHPVGKSAVVIIPSVSSAMKTLVVWKGPEPSQEQKEKSMKYTATVLVNAFRGNGEAIRKRGIFEHLTISESENPENATFSEDVAILLVVKNGKFGWFVKKAQPNSSVLTEIEVPSTALPPLQGAILWLDRVEKASRRD